MFDINDEFKVIEKEGVSGLTFGSHVVKPGFKFKLKDWPYSESMLEAAIIDDRVVKITPDKKESKREYNKVQHMKNYISNNLDTLTGKQIGRAHV